MCNRTSRPGNDEKGEGGSFNTERDLRLEPLNRSWVVCIRTKTEGKRDLPLQNTVNNRVLRNTPGVLRHTSYYKIPFKF